MPSTIDAARARTLTLEKYRLLFASVYVHDARDGSYHLFPPLTESDLRRVVLEADAWHVRCSPTAAHQLYARVAKDGSWVELNEVGHAIR